MAEHCCDMMRHQVEQACESHPDPFECPDRLIAYSQASHGYGLIILDGGSSTVRIFHCPWCGRRLAEEAQTTRGKASLVAAGNTYNPSLIVLRDKGYEFWLGQGENGSLWCAKKGDQRFLVYSGPELLGLVALWEHFGHAWNQQKPDIYSELLEKTED